MLELFTFVFIDGTRAVVFVFFHHVKYTLVYMKRFAWFGIIFTILKTGKTPMDECYF